MGPMGDDDCRLVCGASHEDVALHATPRGLVPSPAVDLPHDRLVSVSFGGDPAVLNLSSPPLSPPPRG